MSELCCRYRDNNDDDDDDAKNEKKKKEVPMLAAGVIAIFRGKRVSHGSASNGSIFKKICRTMADDTSS